MTRKWRRPLAGAAALALLGVLGACGGGGTDAMSAADGGAAEQGADAEEAPAAGVGGSTGAVGSDGLSVGREPVANRPLFDTRAVIRTGEVALTSKDLDAARQQVDAVLAAVDGTVESEQTSHDEKGVIASSRLVLRVPVGRFTEAMAALEAIGTTERADTSSKDVTTEVIDVDERVQTLQNSLDRLQSYQAEARDIEDLLRFEQQITQRQAELQSLEAQQSYLADQTSMATITVTMSQRQTFVPPDRFDDAGFLAGLENGWNALKGTVIVVLTVVGAVLPFAVVLVLVGLPTWLLVRRALRGHAVPAPAAGGAEPPAPPAAQA